MKLSFATNGGDGQFLAVDARGKLQEVGWEKYADARMLSWAAAYLDFEKTRDAKLAMPALIVPVFAQAPTASVVSVTLPRQDLLSQFPTVELDFGLECPNGNMDRACSVWDRIVSVAASCTPFFARGISTFLPTPPFI